ncbi:hypothetical protein D0T56_09955 [Dysgonomonas sp. 520]|nr:hypothetical protein [Dysgonomonas sp. 520]
MITLTNLNARKEANVWNFESSEKSDLSINELKGAQDICIKSLNTYSVEIVKGAGTNEVDKVVWDFGDGTTYEVDNILAGTNTYTQSHSYKRPNLYVLIVRAYRADGSELENSLQYLNINVNSCVVPVNPNIHFYTITDDEIPPKPD